MAYLVDTSAWHRRRDPAVLARWSELLTADDVAITEPLRLEILYSARNAREYDALSDELDGLHPAPAGKREWQRALEVQRALAHRRALHHRAAKIPDLVIAATAELAGLTVLHYDGDYDRIAKVTGQPVEWVAPRGSIN